MPNTKTGGNRLVPDIRPEMIATFEETNIIQKDDDTEETQVQQYKILDSNPIINGVLDKFSYFRTHAEAVWYNKLAGITMLQKINNIISNIGVLSELLTTDKTSLVEAINELNSKQPVLEENAKKLSIGIDETSKRFWFSIVSLSGAYYSLNCDENGIRFMRNTGNGWETVWRK